MAGLQTGGFRPSQSINVRPVDPTQFVVDPNLMIRGLQEGFKFGSDIMTELDDLSLRPDVHAAKQAELKAKKAQAEGAAKTAPVAADSFVADAAAKDQLRDPATKNSLAQYGLGTAEATAQTGLVPQKTQVAKGELDAKAADQALASQVRPFTDATIVNTAAAGVLNSGNAAAVAAGGERFSTTPIQGLNAVAVVDGATGQTQIVQGKTPPTQLKSRHDTIYNPDTKVDEVWNIISDPVTGKELSRELVGTAPGSSESTRKATVAKVASLRASRTLIEDLDKIGKAYFGAKKGGTVQAGLVTAANIDPGLNIGKMALRAGASAMVDPETVKMASAISNAGNTIKNALFGSALTENEERAAKAMMPQPEDIASPDQFFQKLAGLRNFADRQLAGYEKEPPQVQPRAAVDLGSVDVQPKGAPAPAKVSPTPVPASQVPAGARIARDAQGNRAFLQNGVWIPIQE